MSSEPRLRGFTGTVEADETFSGGKSRNMHKGKRKVKGTATVGKAVVMGLPERNTGGTSQARLKHVQNRRRSSVQAEVRSNVYRGAEVHTDALASYTGLDSEYVHKVVDAFTRFVEIIRHREAADLAAATGNVETAFDD